MKKPYLTLFLCFCLYYVNGQNNNNITIGKIETINSKILKEKREIWIHVPDSYSHNSKNEKYPVLYLLDGYSHFHSVVGMIKQLSMANGNGNGNGICPEMIVIGILNTNRTRDLTPTKAKPSPPYLSINKASISGGGDNFISFIEKELIPYIDSKFTTESYRMIIGHSLGGLTVMNTLIHKPELFNSYVAIDPSMWWDNKRLLNEIKNTTPTKRYQYEKLFLGIANTMKKSMDTIRAKKDTTHNTRQIRALLELNAFLKKDILNNLSYKGKYYKEETHGSIPLIAEYDALRYIFDFYQLQITKDEIMDVENDTFDKVQKHYTRLSQVFDREIKPEKVFIEDLGHEHISMQQFEKAEQFFKLNITNYPENFYGYNVLGDLYVIIGNKEKAIENFKKSNSLNKNSYSTEQLDKLQKK